MTEHGPDEHGLGGVQSPVDPRDFPIASLYGSLGLASTVALPSQFRVPVMPPVYDQDGTPQCVAYTAGCIKGHQDRIDQAQFFAWNFGRFFTEIGGGPGGAYMRNALDHMQGTGYPVINVASEKAHRIAAYYAVPLNETEIKTAILQSGPLAIIGPWYHSWFHPVNGVLPTADYQVGGHARTLYGWTTQGLLVRNSWGTDWGLAGDAIMPVNQIATLWEAWRSVDVIDVVTKVVACNGGVFRTGPGTGYTEKGPMTAGETVVVTSTRTGGAWTLTCGTHKTGTAWYRITAVNGKSVQSLYGVPAVFAAKGWFK